ncbi:MAG: tail fiber domain-containing protein [Gammaproteobacteria bacterium]|nr:tail fiber domain-containing protein [Gammaproteobacteria bacterium]
MKTKKLKSLGVGLAGLALVAGANVAAADGANVSVGGIGISAGAAIAGTGSMSIRVGGPGGFSDQVSFSGTSASWSLPGGAADGVYKYDVYTVIRSLGEGKGGQVFRESGSFTVRGGIIQVEGSADGKISQAPSVSGVVERVAEAVVDFLFPAAHAADLTASSATPKIFMDDTDTVGGDWEFFINGNNTTYGNLLRLFDRQAQVEVLHFAGGSTLLQNSLAVDDIGDVGLAGGAVSIDRSLGRVGVGTSTPANSIHITGGNPGIRYDNIGEYYDVVAGDDYTLYHNDGTTTVPVFNVENLPANRGWVTFGGNPGFFPGAPLEVLRSDGTSKILVKETNGTTAARNMFELVNNGPVGFNMTDTTAGTWRFAAQPTGFRISLDGTGGPELEVGNGGTLAVGPGSATRFFVDALGNVTINGTLTQGSDINSKTNIKNIDRDTILAKLAQLPVSQWSYKSDTDSVHMGPMAQDFHKAFGFGPDNKHIAPGDLASVALVGVQELQKQLAARDAEIAELKAQLAQRDALTSEVHARLTTLEGMVQRIAKFGVDDQVAMNTKK